MATTTTVSLPSGSLRVWFKGSPPRISKIEPDSPIAEQISLGQVVVGCSAPDAVTECTTTTPALVHFLLEHAHSDQRTLTVTDAPPPRRIQPDAPLTTNPPRTAIGGTWYQSGGNPSVLRRLIGAVVLYKDPSNGKYYKRNGTEVANPKAPLQELPWVVVEE